MLNTLALRNRSIALMAALMLAGCASSPKTTDTGITKAPEAAETPETVEEKPVKTSKPLPKNVKPELKLSKKTQAAYDRAILSAKAGRDQEAIDLFRKMTDAHPGAAIGYTNLGLLYLKTGELNLAEESLQHAVTLNASDAVAYNHLGVVMREQGRFNEAQTAYLRALKINDKYAEAHLNLGILYDLYLQNLAKALQQYKRYQALTGEGDQQVSKWIIDLQRRVPGSAKN